MLARYLLLLMGVVVAGFVAFLVWTTGERESRVARGPQDIVPFESTTVASDADLARAPQLPASDEGVAHVGLASTPSLEGRLAVEGSNELWDPGALQVQVLNGLGNPARHEPLRVSVENPAGQRRRGTVALGTGLATFRRLEPGRYKVSVDHNLFKRVDPIEVEVQSGRMAELTVDTPRSGKTDSIKVSARWSGLRSVTPRLTSVTLHGGALVTPRRLNGAASKDQAHMQEEAKFSNVPPGVYQIRIDDPQFEPFVVNDVEPGREYVIDLVGSASLDLDLRAGGRPLRGGFHAYLVPDGRQDTKASIRRFKSGFGPTQILRGIPARGYELLIRRSGHEDVRRKIEPLEPGERRRMVVDLPAPLVMSGIVVNDLGDPVRGGSLHVLPEASSLDPADSRGVSRTRIKRDGTFEMKLHSPGTYNLRAANEDGTSELKVVKVGADDVKGLSLTLPRQGWIEVSIEGCPEDIPLDRCRIRPRRVREGIDRRLSLKESSETWARLSSQGSIKLKLPAGRYRAQFSRSLYEETIGFWDAGNEGSEPLFEVLPGKVQSLTVDLAPRWDTRTKVKVTADCSLQRATLQLNDREPRRIRGSDPVEWFGLPPGEYRMKVRLSNALEDFDAGSLFVSSSGIVEHLVHVPFVSDKLQVVSEESSESLSDIWISIQHDSPEATKSYSRQLNSFGRVVLTMEPGDYRVALGRTQDMDWSSAEAVTRITWPPSSYQPFFELPPSSGD